jgi:hypothetical protein
MTLALEVARYQREPVYVALRRAVDALTTPGSNLPRSIAASVERADSTDFSIERKRLLRARLTLALRVLLRADAGDFGRNTGPYATGRLCTSLRHKVDLDGRCRVNRVCGCWEWRREVRPLWCDAPPHEVSR